MKSPTCLCFNAVALTAAITAVADRPPVAPAPAPFVVNDNGAWSWFEDERAVIDAANCTLLVSSVANEGGTGGIHRHGSVEIVAYDLRSGSARRSTLSANFEADDHDSAALYVRRDGRYVAMFSRHNTDAMSRWRISTEPGDASAWTSAGAFDNGAGTTYSNLYEIPAENGGEGRLYNFTRTIDWDPHFLISDDHGSTWSLGGRLLTGPGRPYLRYATNSTDSIHLITTEQHPRDFANSIFHGVIRHGRLLQSDGTVADANLFDDVAVAPEALTKVFAADIDERAWTIDIDVDAAGNPYVVFSVHSTAKPTSQHQYFYGRYDGTHWHVHPLADAGRALYANQGDYTGLVALHPNDPTRLFISTDTHPVTGRPLISRRDHRRHRELFEGNTPDGGATWTWSAVTVDSTFDNIRPIVPRWNSTSTMLLWLRGTYRTYTDYDLDVVGLLLDDSQPSCARRRNPRRRAAPLGRDDRSPRRSIQRGGHLNRTTCRSETAQRRVNVT